MTEATERSSLKKHKHQMYLISIYVWFSSKKKFQHLQNKINLLKKQQEVIMFRESFTQLTIIFLVLSKNAINFY